MLKHALISQISEEPRNMKDKITYIYIIVVFKYIFLSHLALKTTQQYLFEN